MSPIPRSATAAPLAAALRMPIQLPNCRPAWLRWTRPSSFAAATANGGFRQKNSSPAFMRRRCRRRNCWSLSNCRWREKVPCIFSMSLRDGMATTPLSAWRRRRSLRVISSPISGLASLPSATGHYWPLPPKNLSTSPSRRLSCLMPPQCLTKNSIRSEDQQASPAMRRHLAKVLLARSVSALLCRPDLSAGVPA